MSEIFRHLRPTRFNRDRVTVTPHRNGGVSYLVKPTGEGQYEFWLYICPLDAEFSAKVAVQKLRQVVKNGVAPWGSFVMDERPLIDHLVAQTTQTDLPTEVGKMAELIWRQNYNEDLKLQMAQKRSIAVSMYEEME